MILLPFFKKRTRNSGKPRLIIHVGVGKTGTSALQNFFDHNTKNLLQHDICYPTLGRAWTAHHRLSHIIPPLLKHEIPRIPSTVWAKKLANLPYGTFLISTELMHTITQEQVKEYLAPVMERFDVYIALYIRRQDEAILSAYNQGIKSAMRTISLSQHMEHTAPKLDYNEKIRIWASCVGNDRILAAVYDKRHFVEGDLRKDFLNRILNVNDFSQFRFGKENHIVNERLTNDAARIKRALNHISMPVSTMRDLQTVLHEWGKAHPQPYDFWPELSASEQDALMERFTESNRKVATLHFNRDTLFPERQHIDHVYTTHFPYERVDDFAAFLKDTAPSLGRQLQKLYATVPIATLPEELRLLMQAIRPRPVQQEKPEAYAKSR